METFIEQKCKEIAIKHAVIIENECKKVCEKFNCTAEDLIIEYHDNTYIKIKVKGSEFIIENNYIFN